MASGWMKRGIALLNENTTASLTNSLRWFEGAIELRRTLPLDENSWYRYVLAAGWMNRGDALTRLGSTENLAEAVRSYDRALVLLRDARPREQSTIPQTAGVGVDESRHHFARAGDVREFARGGRVFR